MSRYACIITLGLALAAGGTAAATLPLKAGDFVREGTPCADAPFAAQFSYRAGAFAYPHATQCRSVVARRRGQAYEVRETCAALGDGTPATATAVTTRYRVLSPTRVEVTKRYGTDRAAAMYRRCPVDVN